MREERGRDDNYFRRSFTLRRGRTQVCVLNRNMIAYVRVRDQARLVRSLSFCVGYSSLRTSQVRCVDCLETILERFSTRLFVFIMYTASFWQCSFSLSLIRCLSLSAFLLSIPASVAFYPSNRYTVRSVCVIGDSTYIDKMARINRMPHFRRSSALARVQRYRLTLDRSFLVLDCDISHAPSDPFLVRKTRYFISERIPKSFNPTVKRGIWCLGKRTWPAELFLRTLTMFFFNRYDAVAIDLGARETRSWWFFERLADPCLVSARQNQSINSQRGCWNPIKCQSF